MPASFMKTLGLHTLSDDARYRWMVFSRVLAATVGGFLIANLSVPVLAGLFSGQGVLATYSAMLLSFVVWLIAIIWVFSAATLKRVWTGTTGAIIVLALLALLLKP